MRKRHCVRPAGLNSRPLALHHQVSVHVSPAILNVPSHYENHPSSLHVEKQNVSDGIRYVRYLIQVQINLN
jgi:hypothetical protein